jgi:AcrR family transcriptional regulator
MRSNRDGGRDGYHHGNLREALIQAALGLIAERGIGGFAVAELARAVGVSAAAPYRHFRDRDAVLAEVARRGFEALATEMRRAVEASRADPVAALEACAQAHLAFAGRDRPVYSAMFDPHFPVSAHPELTRARDAAFAVLRAAAQAACDRSTAARRPPPLMVALHIWAMTHGIATLFLGRSGAGQLPMSPAELLEAGLLVYLQSLGLSVASTR